MNPQNMFCSFCKIVIRKSLIKVKILVSLFLKCKHGFQEAIVAVDNSRYIRRALDLICDSLLDMLHSGPNSEAKRHAAKCLGKLGYALDQDFKRYEILICLMFISLIYNFE